MSRAGAAKTRGADKTKPPASQTPVIAHEIVPGKFTDNDWNAMVERDSSDEFVLDIMDELMENTMAAIYNKYIERQLLPFTITQARDAIIEIIEWQFLAKDEGEVDIESDLGWVEDEEPEPAVTDCWAQGSVPRNLIPCPSPIPEEEEEVVETDVVTETVAETEPVEQAEQEPEELADVVSDTEENAQVGDTEERSSEKATADVKPPPNGKVKPKTKFRPYRGKLKSAGVSKMTESLEETEMQMMFEEITASMPASEEKPSTLLNMPASCTSILKVQTGRPPGNKDVVYDELGNVVAVMRLDPEKLPTHKVNVKYHVVDPAVEAAQARLDAMRKGKSTGSKLRKARPTKTVSTESLSTSSKVKQPSSSSSVAPLPPPLIEEMEVSHGVIVKEGGRVKKGPGRYYRKLDMLEENQKGMKPLSVRLTNSNITVSDLLDRHTPILRPLGESSPLPPIVPHPPHQPQQVS
ncbi:uncharacterized protein C2orf81 homolog isoform X2 [Aplysia californica]|uniref:Uncharacterized protein C2orf81 homolog isoform X2 n=1 Tax=Aplysia californica TaxID=6500 RepID=A0ABM0JU77_APLCA|nr:uncharacterized protein C2orf81 homolog isoform X2 [Aplysia californica]